MNSLLTNAKGEDRNQLVRLLGYPLASLPLDLRARLLSTYRVGPVVPRGWQPPNDLVFVAGRQVHAHRKNLSSLCQLVGGNSSSVARGVNRVASRWQLSYRTTYNLTLLEYAATMWRRGEFEVWFMSQTDYGLGTLRDLRQFLEALKARDLLG